MAKDAMEGTCTMCDLPVLEAREDAARLEWLGDSISNLEALIEAMEGAPDGVPVRVLIDGLRLEEAAQELGARDA